MTMQWISCSSSMSTFTCYSIFSGETCARCTSIHWLIHTYHQPNLNNIMLQNSNNNSQVQDNCMQMDEATRKLIITILQWFKKHLKVWANNRAEFGAAIKGMASNCFLITGIQGDPGMLLLGGGCSDRDHESGRPSVTSKPGGNSSSCTIISSATIIPLVCSRYQALLTMHW